MVGVWFKADRYGTELTEVPGKVVAALPAARPPGPGGWPAPDLALIQLQRPVEHPCVYVTERSEAMLRSREVRCVGWAPGQGGGLQNRSGVCTVKGSYGGSGDAEQVVRLDGDWVELGMSGGPLVDLVRGEVVGVVKSRLDGHQGGTAVGIERLRTLEVPATPVETETDDIYQAVFHAHDRYHADRHTSAAGSERTWTDAQSELAVPPGGVLGPKLRVDLLGRLAELPPPASTRALLMLLDRLPGVYARDHRPAPRGWRDGLGALYDARARDREARFELIVRYCMGVLAAERPCGQLSVRNAKALWGWVKRIADVELPRDLRRLLDVEWAGIRLRLEQNRQSSARAPAAEPVLYGDRDCVVLHVDLQGWSRDQYDWRVAVDRRGGEAEPVDEDSRGAPSAPSRTGSPPRSPRRSGGATNRAAPPCSRSSSRPRSSASRSTTGCCRSPGSAWEPYARWCCAARTRARRRSARPAGTPGSPPASGPRSSTARTNCGYVYRSRRGCAPWPTRPCRFCAATGPGPTPTSRPGWCGCSTAASAWPCSSGARPRPTRSARSSTGASPRRSRTPAPTTGCRGRSTNCAEG